MTATKLTLFSPEVPRVVFDGQSHNWVPEPPFNVPAMCMKGRKLPWHNIAVGGHGWFALQSKFPITRLTKQARKRGLDILVMNGGQGDIINPSADGWGGQHTGEQAYELAVEYAGIARAAGFDRIIGVVPPAIGPDAFPGGRPTLFETQALQDLRALTIQDPEGAFDAVANCNVAPLNNAWDLRYFAWDRLHFVKEGARAMGQIIGETLDPFLEQAAA